MPSADVSTISDAHSFSGDESFAASAGHTFATLIDPAVLAQCIPDLVSSQRVDDRTLQCTVRPGFSFIRAKLKMTLSLKDVDSTQRTAMIDIVSKGIGTSMNVQCRLAVHEHGNACRVRWNADIVERRGLIAAVSPALIRGAADKVIQDGWSALRPIVEK